MTVSVWEKGQVFYLPPPFFSVGIATRYCKKCVLSLWIFKLKKNFLWAFGMICSFCEILNMAFGGTASICLSFYPSDWFVPNCIPFFFFAEYNFCLSGKGGGAVRCGVGETVIGDQLLQDTGAYHFNDGFLDQWKEWPCLSRWWIAGLFVFIHSHSFIYG